MSNADNTTSRNPDGHSTAGPSTAPSGHKRFQAIRSLIESFAGCLHAVLRGEDSPEDAESEVKRFLAEARPILLGQGWLNRPHASAPDSLRLDLSEFDPDASPDRDPMDSLADWLLQGAARMGSSSTYHKRLCDSLGEVPSPDADTLPSSAETVLYEYYHLVLARAGVGVGEDQHKFLDRALAPDLSRLRAESVGHRAAWLLRNTACRARDAARDVRRARRFLGAELDEGGTSRSGLPTDHARLAQLIEEEPRTAVIRAARAELARRVEAGSLEPRPACVGDCARGTCEACDLIEAVNMHFDRASPDDIAAALPSRTAHAWTQEISSFQQSVVASVRGPVALRSIFALVFGRMEPNPAVQAAFDRLGIDVLEHVRDYRDRIAGVARWARPGTTANTRLCCPEIQAALAKAADGAADPLGRAASALRADDESPGAARVRLERAIDAALAWLVPAQLLHENRQTYYRLVIGATTATKAFAQKAGLTLDELKLELVKERRALLHELAREGIELTDGEIADFMRTCRISNHQREELSELIAGWLAQHRTPRHRSEEDHDEEHHVDN